MLLEFEILHEMFQNYKFHTIVDASVQWFVGFNRNTSFYSIVVIIFYRFSDKNTSFANKIKKFNSRPGIVFMMVSQRV